MAEKYLDRNDTSGKLTRVEGLTSSAGAGDSGKIPALDSAGKLDASMMPVGVVADVKVLVTSEDLSAGDYVNIYDVTGTETARLADSSNSREAHGFVLSATTSPASATVYFEGPNTGRSGLVAGIRQYLSTAGDATAVVPTSGIHQLLGVAIDATTINTDIQDVIVL